VRTSYTPVARRTNSTAAPSSHSTTPPESATCDTPAAPAPHPARIRALTSAVIPTVHLNNELHRRSHEVSDEAPRNRHLPPKLHAELARGQFAPEQVLPRERPPIQPSALFQFDLSPMTFELVASWGSTCGGVGN